jgi:Fic family protein
MIRNATGRYQSSIAGGETVRAFVPDPLPPDPALQLTGGRQRLLEKATLALGRLDSITQQLPDPRLFLYAYVRREAVLSSQIEGTQSSISDLMLYEIDHAPGVPLGDVQEVSNYIAALEYGVDQLRRNFPLSNRLLRQMHHHLMARGRGHDKAPGEFRRTQNWIGGTRPGNAYFVPPPPQEVPAAMGALEKFLHADDDLPCLLRAALAHVQFETIHPFLDGNGRLGRLLIVLLLHHDGILQQPLLYLSLYFKQHRSVYYQLLDRVRTHGDWEAWVDFFLEGVQSTASNAEQTAQRLLQLFRDDQVRVQTLGRQAQRLFDYLQRRPIVSVKKYAEEVEISFPTANSAVKALANAGLLREMTGKARDRVYAYQAYVDILSEDGAPL